MNAVHQLFLHRKHLSTTTYKSRGFKVVRCENCRLAQKFCICELAPIHQLIDRNKLDNSSAQQAGFLLLMYDTEILKPSNTGRLIADLVPDTFAFLWSRTEENPELLTVLADEQWQPFVVFPAQYAQEGRQVIQDKVVCEPGKRPLFILLDGSWREAKKMFRKSPYLAKFPMVSFDPTKHLPFASANDASASDPEQVSEHNLTSRYHMRIASGENQFGTAEVAARVLSMAGEQEMANVLDLWFDVFSYQYQKSVCQKNKGNPQAIEQYLNYIKTLT